MCFNGKDKSRKKNLTFRLRILRILFIEGGNCSGYVTKKMTDNVQIKNENAILDETG